MARVARVVPPDYLPRPNVQLDGTKYAGANCGCVMTANAIAWSTGGALHPSPTAVRNALDGIWVGQQSTPPDDSTSLSDQQRAWSSFRDDARKLGYRLGSYTRHLMEPWAAVEKALEDGFAVGLQYDYGYINAHARGQSGSPTFDGFHVALIVRKRASGGRTSFLVYDGLYDGRRADIPKGPQWVPGWVLKRAAEEKVRKTLIAGGTSKADAARLSAGRAVFAVIARSEPIAKPEPEPAPEPHPEPTPTPPTCDELITEAVELATGWRDQRITSLEVALGTARTALMHLRALGQEADDAMADIAEALGETPPSDEDPAAGVGADS